MDSNQDFQAEITLRKASAEDAETLLAIYAPYVEKTALTFECAVPTVDEFRRRILTFSQHYPYLVAEADGSIVGYSYAHAFHERAAYHCSVETTIYLAPTLRHQGIGRRLYTQLEQQLERLGYTNLYACLTFKDEPDAYLPTDSLHFHEAMGYTLCAHFHQCGYKFHHWYDVVWLEKFIGEHR